ncbi:uncharacterized protein FFMR_06861 [Fusarium fujikuroi]|nr:uncharacterized protein FFMR_06861 [Fusarium fujikuroi]
MAFLAAVLVSLVL